MLSTTNRYHLHAQLPSYCLSNIYFVRFIQVNNWIWETETVLGRWEMQNACKRSKSAIFGPEGDSPVIPAVQDPLQQNFAETLPTEMSVRIFSELDVRSLCRASVTCRHWNDIIEGSDHLWRSHCLTVLAVCRREVNGDRLDGCSWKVCVIVL